MTREYEGFTDYHGRFHAPDPERCKARVWGTFDAHQCDNKAKRDGWCGMHHPDADAKRKAKSDALWNEKKDGWRRSQLAHDFHGEAISAVKQIAAGHNNPRGLCEEIIEKFKEIL